MSRAVAAAEIGERRRQADLAEEFRQIVDLVVGAVLEFELHQGAIGDMVAMRVVARGGQGAERRRHAVGDRQPAILERDRAQQERGLDRVLPDRR